MIPTKTYSNGRHKAESGDRLLPQDKEAERGLIGSLLTDPSQIHEVAAAVSKEDFYLAANGLIFEAIQGVTRRGEYPDIVSVMAELRTAGHADIGDGQDRAEGYLLGILGSNYFTYSAVGYARIVAEMATRRRLIAASQTIAADAWDEKQELPDIMETSRQALFNVAERQRGRGLSHISASMQDYMLMVEERANNPGIPGLATGFPDLDKLLNGLQKQQLIIIAARPGMGKTGLMLAMVDEMTVMRKKRGAFYSLEMSRDELTTRLVARRIRIDTQRIDRGEFKENEWPEFYNASGLISQAPLYIDDTQGASLGHIRTQAMRQSMETGLDYIMVDYLGLVSVPGTKSRYEQVSESARFFKNLAREIDVPVVVASQLNRGLEARADKRPLMSDLRDSGEIEEAANVILSIYRDDYYNTENSERPNIGEVESLKNRNGPVGTVDLYWHSQLATYRNLQRHDIQL